MDTEFKDEIDDVVEANPVEESVAEEIISEQTPQEEIPQEETPLEENPPKKSSKLKTIIIISSIVAVVAILAVLAIVLFIPMLHYNKGEKLFEQGNYHDAMEQFEAAGDYNDAPSRLVVSTQAYHFENGKVAFEAEDFLLANQEYLDANGYKTSADDAVTAMNAYHNQQGHILHDSGEYLAAVDEFELANGYGDSATGISEAKYSYALEIAQDGQYIEAADIYAEIIDYRDSDEMIMACGIALLTGIPEAINDESTTDETKAEITAICDDVEYVLSMSHAEGALEYKNYAIGCENFVAGHFTDAKTNFQRADGVLNSEELIKACNYFNGFNQMRSGRFDDAKISFRMAGDYRDSEFMIDVCEFGKGEQSYRTGELNEAREIFEGLPEDFSYEGYSVAERLDSINSHSAYANMCGVWEITGGEVSIMRNYTYTRDGWNVNYQNAPGSFEGAFNLAILCTINDDGSVTLNGLITYVYMPEYSYLKEYQKMEAGSAEFTIENASTSFSNVEIAPNLTLSYSNGQFRANYNKTDIIASGIRDVASTTMTFGERVDPM